MHLSIDTGLVRFETKLHLTDFPRLVQAHLTHVSNTLAHEQLGQTVIEQGFSWVVLQDFIFNVCDWGGYKGIAGRIAKQNAPEYIQAHFLQAHTHMMTATPDVGAALHAINQIKQLNTPSFASKHLRLLYPHICPVLDQVIVRLGYAFTPTGYQAFADDCTTIARSLVEQQIENPIARPSKQWYAGDIDMALFAYLNDWLDC